MYWARSNNNKVGRVIIASSIGIVTLIILLGLSGGWSSAETASSTTIESVDSAASTDVTPPLDNAAGSSSTRAPISTLTLQDFESGSAAVIDGWWNGFGINVNTASNAHTGSWHGVITPTAAATNGNAIFHQADPWTTSIDLDISSYERLCMWVFDESSTSGTPLALSLEDSSGTGSSQVTTSQHTAPGEWRKLCWNLSDFTPASSLTAFHRMVLVTTAVPGLAGANTVSGPFRVDDVHLEENTPLACGTDELRGTIFHDYNSNGAQDRAEPGVANANLTIVNAAGTSALVTSDSEGAYSSTGVFAAGDDVRIELAIPSGYYAAASGNTSVVFSTAGTCGIDIGVYQADRYCQDNPDVATSCYVAGVYTGTNSALDVVVSFPYTASGIAHTLSGDTPAFTPDHDASTGELGTTWGLAYQRSTQTMFAGAMLKRLTDFGPLGSGGIYTLDYSVDPSNPTIGQWVDIADTGGLNIATGADPRVEDGIPLSDDGTTPLRDQTAYDNVGKRALGDLEIDTDNTLWFVNLLDQSLYGIENADPATTPTAALGPYFIPDEIADVDCADSDVRPWGLKFHENVLYVGVVCSAESTATATDLHAYVLTFDINTRSFTGTAFDFDLSNRYACVYWEAEPDGCTWRPWGMPELTFGSDPGGFDVIMNPQPVLSDIEFDIDGSMILGFLDRHGHQSGLQNYSGDPTDPNPNYTGMAGGDIVRVCNIGGTFELESGGICANGDTENGFGGAYSGLTQGSYGRGEYYLDDNEPYSTGLTHSETSNGGVALLPGSGSIVYSAMNPIGRTNSGGLRWNSNETGLSERGAELFQGFIDPLDPSPPVFGKATGIGEVELLCALPSLEVGNRVWEDLDRDGVQDPGEHGLDGVTVTLTCGADMTTTVTANGGQYFFGNDAAFDDTASHRTRATFMDVGEACTLSISAQTITAVNNGSNDLHDSDANSSGDINFTVGATGENNHTFDFGVAPLPTCADHNLLFITERDDYPTDYDDYLINRLEKRHGFTVTILDEDSVVPGSFTGQQHVYMSSPVDLGETLAPLYFVNPTFNYIVGEHYQMLDDVLLATSDDYTSTGGDQITLTTAIENYADGSSIDIWNPDPAVREIDWGVGVGNDATIVAVVSQATASTGANGSGASANTPQNRAIAFYYVAGNTLVGGGTANANFGFLGVDDGYWVGTQDGDVVEFTAAFNALFDRMVESTYACLPTVEIGNYVWLDADADGLQDATEAGINGVRVELWRDPDGTPGNGDEVLEQVTQTRANGEYYFTVATNTNYYVALNEDDLRLAGLALTARDSGGDDGIDSDGQTSLVTNKIIIPLTSGGAGEHDYTYDFGFTPLGVIGNYIWLDENSDGLQDAGEPGIPNVTVILRDATNTPILTTTTDANGGYLFSDLPPGTYSVDVVDSSVPTGMSQTTIYTNGTGDFGNKDHSGNGYSVTIGNGQPLENLTADFGYNYNPTPDVNDPSGSPTAALGDRVWYDTDADGVQDPDEIGIYNVCLELFTAGADGVFGTADDASQGTTTTDYNGNYIFDGLTPGAYTVRVCSASLTGVLNGLSQTGDPDHFGSAETGAHYEDDHRTTNPVILGPGDVFLNVDFGYDGGTVGSIGDTIFYDVDADGNGPSLTAIDDATAVTQGAGGTADSTDRGIAGVTISLIRDLDGDGVWDAGEPIVATTVTDANGQYLFGGLPLDDGGGDSDADYIVWVNDVDNVLDGLGQTYDSDGVLASPNQSAVALSSGSPDARDQDFGYSAGSPQGSIGDTIWNDVNGNGASTPDGGEPGIANVGIKLFADADANGIADDINGDGIINDSDALRTTVTDANGNYLFERLPLDSYLIEVCDETLPAGFNTTPTYDPDGTTPINIGTTVTLTEMNPANRDQDFSYTYTDPDLGSIGDQLWSDLDNGGESAPEAGDPPLVGVVVYLTSSSGYSATAVTDENGYYLFENLPAGVYTITVDSGTLPPGLTIVPSYDPDPTDDGVSSITLATGEHNRDQDFAYPPSGTPEGMIGDTVWFDIDRDGNGPGSNGTTGGDNSEPGLADVCVSLYQDLGAIGTFEPSIDVLLDTTRTDASGNYLFTGLSLDDGGGDTDFDYVVVVDTNCLPAYVSPESTYDNDAPTADSISFTSLDASSISTGSHIDLDQDFGYGPTASLGTIGDTIWFDRDNSGTSTVDAGEPGLEGVLVQLVDEDGNIWTTLTDENGNYTFSNLPLGRTYTVTIPASNFASGGVLEGMTNTYDPDNNDDNAGVGITLTGTDPINLDQDFSYTGSNGQLGNLVWLDMNADGDDDSGTAGSGEGPIANVTLDLYRDLNCDGLIDAGEPLFGSTTTVGVVNAGSYGTNGVYDFDGLPVVGAGAGGGSCWAVDVTDENGVLAGYWHSLGTQGADNHSQADPYADSGTGQLELTAASPTNLTADFGYYVDPAAVGNFVWFDFDYDGVQDSGEPGMNGITVTLVITYPDNTTLTLMTVTGDDPATSGTTELGWYSFGNLLYDEDYATSSGTTSAGSSPARPAYVVSMEMPSGYIPTVVNAVAASGDQDDADDPAGVPATATVGSQTTTQNSDPSAETNPIASYDFGLVRIELGDLPNDRYHTFIANSGARHVIWPDWNNDNVPDVTGAIWSGMMVDVETEGRSGGDNGQTTGDDTDGIDDEDGLIIPPRETLIANQTVTFSVTLRSRDVQTADYGLWIDWDGNNSFGDENEFISRNDIAINTLVSDNIYEATFTLTTTVPSGVVEYPSWIYIRGRVFAANSGTTRDALVGAHNGLASNGEVEDFAIQPPIPTAVGLTMMQTSNGLSAWFAWHRILWGGVFVLGGLTWMAWHFRPIVRKSTESTR